MGFKIIHISRAQGSETILYDTVRVDMKSCICQIPRNYTTKRVNPNVTMDFNNNVSILVHQLQQMYHTNARC